MSGTVAVKVTVKSVAHPHVQTQLSSNERKIDLAVTLFSNQKGLVTISLYRTFRWDFSVTQKLWKKKNLNSLRANWSFLLGYLYHW